MASSSVPAAVPVDRLAVAPAYRLQELRERKLIRIIQPVSGASLTAAAEAGAAAAAQLVADALADLRLGLQAAALTQTTVERAGPPDDLAPGQQRIEWNTARGAPSLWMNRGGTIIDAFNPGTF